MSVATDVADRIDADALDEPETDDDRRDRAEHAVRALVEPQTHAIKAKLMWDGRGLTPYWGFVRQFSPDLDEREFSVNAVGTEWFVSSSSYHRGKLAPPESADFEGVGMYEYHVTLVDDRSIDRDVSLVVRPGFPDAEHVDTGESIGGMPDDCPESIRVETTATNVHPENVIPVVREFFSGLGLSASFLDDEPHEYSRLIRLERYVRIERPIFEAALVGRGGVLDRLAAFGQDSGQTGGHSWDHREALGHYEETRLDADTWDLLFDGSEASVPDGLGFAAKGYHPKHVRDESADGPLASPKFEVAYRKRWSDDALEWDRRDEAIDSTRAVLWNALEWAGVDPSLTAGHWVPDDYFEPRAAEVDDAASRVVPSPLDAIERKREEGVVDALASTNLSDEQRRVLVALFDSSSNHYRALAERADVGTSTVYRLLDNLGDLLESMRGQIRFADKIARERVGGVVDRLRDVADWGRDRVDEAAELAGRWRDGPLAEWVRRHAIQVVADDPTVEVDLGDGLTLDEARRIARSGLRRTATSGSGGADLDRLLVRWRDRRGTDKRALVTAGDRIKFNLLIG